VINQIQITNPGKGTVIQFGTIKILEITWCFNRCGGLLAIGGQCLAKKLFALEWKGENELFQI
jgi:hypothetical protein